MSAALRAVLSFSRDCSTEGMQDVRHCCCQGRMLKRAALCVGPAGLQQMCSQRAACRECSCGVQCKRMSQGGTEWIKCHCSAILKALLQGVKAETSLTMGWPLLPNLEHPG